MKNENINKYRDEFVAVGLKIGYLRRQRGMTQEQLAEKAGLGHDYLRQIESSKDRHHVSLISLYKISRALDVSMDVLVAENNDE